MSTHLNIIFPHKTLIVHLPDLSFLCYIYTNKVNCLPCMLFTCLFLLPHALLRIQLSNGAAHEIDVFTSGFGAGVFWQIKGH